MVQIARAVGKVYAWFVRRLGGARLEITLSPHAVSFVLPQDYEDKKVEYYPVALDVAREDDLSGLKRFEGRTLKVHNKGRKEPAEECEIEANLLTTSITLPVQAYWKGGQDLVHILPRELREIVPFLVDREKEEIIFCTAFFPHHIREGPRWQFSLPIRSSFTLSIMIRSSSASTIHKEFDLKGEGPGAADIRIVRIRDVLDYKA